MRVTKIPGNVMEDLAIIRDALGSGRCRLALFGSVCWKAFDKTKDVDVACFLADVNPRDAAHILSELPLSYPVRCASLNGAYAAAPPKKGDHTRDYHVIFLDGRSPNTNFVERNRDTLKIIFP